MDKTATIPAVSVKGDNRAMQRQGSVLQAVNRVTLVQSVKLVCLLRLISVCLFILYTVKSRHCSRRLSVGGQGLP